MSLLACGHGATSSAPTPPPDLASAFNSTPLYQTGVTVVVTRDHTSVNGAVVSPATIIGEMRTIKSQSDSAEDAATIEGTSTAKYGTVLAACGAAVTAGFTHLGLANRVKGRSNSGTLAGFEKTGLRGNGMHLVPWRRRSSQISEMVDEHPVEVEVSSGDRILIDGSHSADPYHDLALAIAFHSRHRDTGYSRRVVIIGDADTDWGTIIEILDAARIAKDDDVSFVTRI